LWLHSLKVAQLLRSAACLHTNQSRSYLNHLVFPLLQVPWDQMNLLQCLLTLEIREKAFFIGAVQLCHNVRLTRLNYCLHLYWGTQMPNVVMFPLAVYTKSSQASRKSFSISRSYGARTFHNIPLTLVFGSFWTLTDSSLILLAFIMSVI